MSCLPQATLLRLILGCGEPATLHLCSLQAAWPGTRCLPDPCLPSCAVCRQMLDPTCSCCNLRVGIPCTLPAILISALCSSQLQRVLGCGKLQCVGATTAWEVQVAAPVSTETQPFLQQV